MAKLQFVIDGQKLKCSTPSVMVSDTIRYFGADFSFLTKAWAGLTKYAHFQRGKNVYDVLLTDDKISETEHEMSLEAGEWTVWVHGAEYDEESRPIRRITTTDVTFTVVQSGALEGEMFPSVIPSVAEQLVAEAERFSDYAEDAASRAQLFSAEADRSEQRALEYSEEAETFADRAEQSMFEAERKAEEARQSANNAKETSDAIPAKVTEYIESHKAELKGDPGEPGKPGEDGKDADPYDDTEIRGEVRALNDGLAKKIETVKVNGTELEKVDGAVDIPVKIFTCEYGITTFEEVKNAFNRGYICVCWTNGRMYILTNTSGTPVNMFWFESRMNETFYRVQVNSSNAWMFGNISGETTYYKRTAVTESPNNLNYLTEKAIVDYLSANYQPKEKEWVMVADHIADGNESNFLMELGADYNEVWLMSYAPQISETINIMIESGGINYSYLVVNTTPKCANLITKFNGIKRVPVLSMSASLSLSVDPISETVDVRSIYTASMAIFYDTSLFSKRETLSSFYVRSATTGKKIPANVHFRVYAR